MRLPKEVEEAIDNIRQLNKRGGTAEEAKIALEILVDACAEPDIAQMTLTQLKDYKEELLEQMEELEDDEPDEEDEDVYDDWEVEYEELEDLIEEVDERIEELS